VRKLSEEEDIKRIASTKLWIEERIRSLETEIEVLRETLIAVDSYLMQKGFKPATEIMESATVDVMQEKPVTEVRAEEVLSLKTKNDNILATAYVSPRVVTVVPASTAKLRTSTPPFNSYLIGKKLPQMADVDKQQVKSHVLEESLILDFSIEEKDDFISKIIVKNYRTKDRLKEILNLITWTFEKMLEKS